MTIAIQEWKDIADDFHQGTILLGNGASMAVSERFGYRSLWEKAIEIRAISENIQRIFDHFQTNDFELVLRLVWQASIINNALEVNENNQTNQAYREIKDSLINAVRSAHPSFDTVQEHIKNACVFLRRFDTILSLNYDLLVYWAIIQNNNRLSREEKQGHSLKDCFLRTSFDRNWKRLRKPMRTKGERHCTLVFYPHGSLIISRDEHGHERKIHCNPEEDLLNSVLNYWNNENCIPIFVSEGDSEQKIAAIQSSHYLSTVYWEVLGESRESLTVYGWSFGEQDEHLLKRMADSGIKRIAVSVYKNENERQNHEYMERIKKIISDNLGRNIKIIFFDSQSPGCWINPPSNEDK